MAYKLTLYLNESYLEIPYASLPETIESFSVSFRDGYLPRFFINGEYVGEGDADPEPDDTDTTDLVIGNSNELADVVDDNIKHVCVCNQALTDREHLALYEESLVIGAIEMEAGNRTRQRNVYTAAAVAQSVDPGGAFQLIDITVQFNTAPTTSEALVVSSVNSDTDTVTEYRCDPSVAGVLDATTKDIVMRFDKRFPDNTTISVAYTNTDGRTIKVNTVYQLDQSVV